MGLPRRACAPRLHSPRAQAARNAIIAFERDDNAAFFEQLENVRAALTRGFCHRDGPVLVRQQRVRAMIEKPLEVVDGRAMAERVVQRTAAPQRPIRDLRRAPGASARLHRHAS